MVLYKKYKDDIEKYKRKNKIFCRSNKKVLEDICIIDINNNSNNFSLIDKKHWTEKIIIYALSRNGHNLAFVDKNIPISNGSRKYFKELGFIIDQEYIIDLLELKNNEKLKCYWKYKKIGLEKFKL